MCVTVTTVVVWVMCSLNANGCDRAVGNVARNTAYRSSEECLAAAAKESATLWCKPRTEIMFNFIFEK